MLPFLLFDKDVVTLKVFFEENSLICNVTITEAARTLSLTDERRPEKMTPSS